MKTGNSNSKFIVVLVVLLVIVGYLAVWKPHAAEVTDVKASNDALAQELATLNVTAAVRVPVTAVSGTPMLEAAIPAAPELPSLLRQLQRIATEAGVTLGAVSTAPVVANGGAPGGALTVTISVTGTKLAAYDYVQRLGTLERLFVVDALTETPTAANPAADPTVAVVDSLGLAITGRVFTTSGAATSG